MHYFLHPVTSGMSSFLTVPKEGNSVVDIVV